MGRCSASSSLPSWTSSAAAFDAVASSYSVSLVVCAGEPSAIRRCRRSDAGTTAANTRSAASSFSRQQRLYFLPLPHGQGSFRPVLAIAVLTFRRTTFLVPNTAGGCQISRATLAFDRDLAAVARAAGCARCGGVLHSARFRRKPRGGPVGLGEAYDQRLSFCCASDLCRKRTSPRRSGSSAAKSISGPWWCWFRRCDRGRQRRGSSANCWAWAGGQLRAGGVVAPRPSRRARSGNWHVPQLTRRKNPWSLITPFRPWPNFDRNRSMPN